MDPEILRLLYQEPLSLNPDYIKNLVINLIRSKSWDELRSLPDRVFYEWDEDILTEITDVEMLPVFNELMFRFWLAVDEKDYSTYEIDAMTRIMVFAVKNKKKELFRCIAEDYDFRFSHLIRYISDNGWLDILTWIHEKDIRCAYSDSARSFFWEQCTADDKIQIESNSTR